MSSLLKKLLKHSLSEERIQDEGKGERMEGWRADVKVVVSRPEEHSRAPTSPARNKVVFWVCFVMMRVYIMSYGWELKGTSPELQVEG